ncbi:hypothetical protein VTO42DRAFT_1860 [Malbranchea cinnamomea]
MTLPVPRKLWEHPDPESTNMGKFRRALEQHTGSRFETFSDLYQYSINNRSAFYDFLWKYFGIIHEGSYTTVVDESARIDSIPAWFKGIRLNFAENVLFSTSAGSSSSPTKAGKEDSKIAVTEVREGKFERIVQLTWGELRGRAGKLMQAMKAAGVRKGDCVAVVASNSIDTLLVFLAVTALGGVFSSSSTDMGVDGILSRLRQIKPRWLFMDDTARYNRKTIDLREKMKSIVQGMQGIKEFQGIVAIPRFASQIADVSAVPKAQTLASFLAKRKSDVLEFERVNFSDPFLVVYSSGTTGQPKCIVHSVGGVLLNANKEGRLHHEMGEDSVILQYTTTGWIMYLVAIQSLAFGARAVLYDGSPFVPDPSILIRLAEEQRVTHLGISPRFLQELQSNGIKPRNIADLSCLKIVTCTGMVLSDSLFEWFYDEAFPTPVQLANMSGGTDLAGCFGVGNSLSPVFVGGCSGFSLGVPVAVYDDSLEGGIGVKGVPVKDGVPGELVATAAFPNMPVTFWGENGQQRYFEAYFKRFDNVWTHGDIIMIHPVTRHVLFLGRADGVLNPSGIRFGSAEIYSVVESRFSSSIADSLCVGQRRPQDQDETVLLFLLMKPGVPFTKKLVTDVKSAIRRELSPRHVPKYIFQTPEIPTTVNMKKVETIVKQIVSGKKVKPSGTLLNPQCLDYYYQFVDIERFAQPKAKL